MIYIVVISRERAITFYDSIVRHMAFGVCIYY